MLDLSKAQVFAFFFFSDVFSFDLADFNPQFMAYTVFLLFHYSIVVDQSFFSRQPFCPPSLQNNINNNLWSFFLM